MRLVLPKISMSTEKYVILQEYEMLSGVLLVLRCSQQLLKSPQILICCWKADSSGKRLNKYPQCYPIKHTLTTSRVLSKYKQIQLITALQSGLGFPPVFSWCHINKWLSTKQKALGDYRSRSSMWSMLTHSHYTKVDSAHRLANTHHVTERYAFSTSLRNKTSNLITSNLWLPGHHTIGWAVWANFHAQHEVSTRADWRSLPPRNTPRPARICLFTVPKLRVCRPSCWTFYYDVEDH